MAALALISSNGRRFFVTFVSFVTCFFILYYALYGVFNNNGPLAPLMSLRYYKNFFIFLFVSTLSVRNFNDTMCLIKYALFVSIPISFYQFFTADRGNEAWWDEIGGILGRDGQSGTLSLLILVYVLFEYFRRIRDKTKLFDWYLLTLIPMFLNETKVVIFLVPVVFIIVSLIYSARSVGKVIFAAPLFILGAFSINAMYVTLFGYSLFNTINYDFIEGYFFADDVLRYQEVDVGRFMRLIYAHEYLSNQPLITQLFGEGLGATFYGENSGVEGKLVSEFFLLRLHTGSKIQLYQMILEFGYVGSVIFILLVLMPLFRVALSKSRSDYDIVVLISVPVFILGMLYQPVIETKAIAFLMSYSVAVSLYNGSTVNGSGNNRSVKIV